MERQERDQVWDMAGGHRMSCDDPRTAFINGSTVDFWAVFWKRCTIDDIRTIRAIITGQFFVIPRIDSWCHKDQIDAWVRTRVKMTGETGMRFDNPHYSYPEFEFI